MLRGKVMLAMLAAIGMTTIVANYYVEASEEPKLEISWGGETWDKQEIAEYETGRIVYLAKEGAELCTR